MQSQKQNVDNDYVVDLMCPWARNWSDYWTRPCTRTLPPPSPTHTLVFFFSLSWCCFTRCIYSRVKDLHFVYRGCWRIEKMVESSGHMEVTLGIFLMIWTSAWMALLGQIELLILHYMVTQMFCVCLWI